MKTQVIVGLGSCGIAAGAGKVYDVLLNINKEKGADFSLSRTSCIGMCYREPLVEVIDERGSVIYGNVDEDRAREIVARHLINREIIEEWIVRSEKIATSDDTFFRGQVKIALRNCGIIDPEKVGEYEKMGGYKALEMIAAEKIPSEKIVQMVIDSGLRVRRGRIPHGPEVEADSQQQIG
jgi:(2Fe-2S) ferredoxin